MNRSYYIFRRSDNRQLAVENDIKAAFAMAERLAAQFGNIVIRDALGGRVADVNQKPKENNS